MLKKNRIERYTMILNKGKHLPVITIPFVFCASIFFAENYFQNNDELLLEVLLYNSISAILSLIALGIYSYKLILSKDIKPGIISLSTRIFAICWWVISLSILIFWAAKWGSSSEEIFFSLSLISIFSHTLSFFIALLYLIGVVIIKSTLRVSQNYFRLFTYALFIFLFISVLIIYKGKVGSIDLKTINGKENRDKGTVYETVINPDAAYRFKDLIWFGGVAGLFRAHIGSLSQKESVLVVDNLGEVFAFEHTWTHLLLGTEKGVYCVNPENLESISLTPQMPFKNLFRTGEIRWATNENGNLYRLGSTKNKCRNMMTEVVDLDNRKYLRSVYAENIIWMAACYMYHPNQKTNQSQSLCGLYRINVDISSPPILEYEFSSIVDMAFTKGSLWVLTVDGLYRMRKETPENVQHISSVGKDIKYFVKNETEFLVESEKGVWRWSEKKSQLYKVPASLLQNAQN